jgi:hypothetical protein
MRLNILAAVEFDHRIKPSYIRRAIDHITNDPEANALVNYIEQFKDYFTNDLHIREIFVKSRNKLLPLTIAWTWAKFIFLIDNPNNWSWYYRFTYWRLHIKVIKENRQYMIETQYTPKHPLNHSYIHNGVLNEAKEINDRVFNRPSFILNYRRYGQGYIIKKSTPKDHLWKLVAMACTAKGYILEENSSRKTKGFRWKRLSVKQVVNNNLRMNKKREYSLYPIYENTIRGPIMKRAISLDWFEEKTVKKYPDLSELEFFLTHHCERKVANIIKLKLEQNNFNLRTRAFMWFSIRKIMLNYSKNWLLSFYHQNWKF